MTVEAVLKDLKARKYAPVYVFHGDEPYYNEQLVKFMEENILNHDEKEFNFTVLYGADVSPEDVVVTARRFPMMAEYQVTIVKEAQAMKRPGPDVYQRMVSYIEKPNPNTILVLFFRGVKVPKRAVSEGASEEKAVKPVAILPPGQKKAPAPKKQKSFYDAASEHVMVESSKMRDEKIPEWAAGYFQKRGYRINARAAILLAESLGNELNKVTNEADKLMLNHHQGYEFTERDVEESVGVSKEYTAFELQSALATKNILKANKIAFFMGQQEKVLPIQMVLPTLLTFFMRSLQYHWLKSTGKTSNMAQEMGVNPYFMREYETMARNYSPAKVIKIIHHLRDYDMRSKGWNTSDNDSGKLMKELVFKIIH